MERYEVPIDETLAPLVEALERGDEVILTRLDGPDVAVRAVSTAPKSAPMAKRGFDLLSQDAIDRFRELRGGIRLDDLDAVALVRAIRDEDP